MNIEFLLYLLGIWPAFGLIDAGSLYNNNSVPATHRTYNKVKSFSKRHDSACRQFTQYWFNGTCCNSCEPGSIVKTPGCTKDNPKTLCQSCVVGKEYLDHYNHLTKCRRCRICDTEHGMEVESPCTTTQNVKCRCIPDFFCNSTKPCDHCSRCDKCEHGIVKNCTQTENTICKAKTDNSLLSWLIPAIILTVLLLLIIVVLLIRSAVRKKQKNIENQTGNNNAEQRIRSERKRNMRMVSPSQEMEPLCPDIDLSHYILDIAQEMTPQEVKLLVRKLDVPPNCIDEITYNNPHDAAEQKIKLLDAWYQNNGRKGAYQTLMSTMRKNGLRATAEKLQGIIEADRRASED